MSKRLRSLPHAPHNLRPKKQHKVRKVKSWSKAIEDEVMRVLKSPQDDRKCSPKRGIISTKLQGR